MRMRRIVLPVAALLVLGMTLPAPSQEGQTRPIKLKVTAEQANLREKPDIGSAIVQQIPEGAVLEADRKEGEWFFVRYALEDGGVIGGFIHESLVEVVAEGGPAAEAVKKPPTETPKPAAPAGAKPAAPGTGSFPVEISVLTGVGSFAPRDINDGTRGYADWNGAVLGIPAPGPADILHLGFLIGFDLSYRFSPRLAIGLGIDVLSGGNSDRLEYEDPLAPETLLTKPTAKAVPVKLTARFYPGSGFYVRGSLGLYSIRAGYLYRHERTDSWQQWKGSARATVFGGEAAFGGEWAVAAQSFFFVEAGFRLARVEGLTGKDVYTDSADQALTESGTLYFYKVAVDSKTYPHLFVRESAPTGEGISGSRLADVNLSGITFLVGIRYRF